MITIVDYGMGNVGSIVNMLKKVGVKDIQISHDTNDIMIADGLILPGVGAFDSGMTMLKKFNLIDCLNNSIVKDKKPVLGICLGMQLLGNRSEEGKEPGLGYIDFENIRLNTENFEIKVPHMGWDYVKVLKSDSKLLYNLQKEPRYYFVHSYYAKCKYNEDILMTCHYGTDITVAVQHNNIYGVQFHPEKSHNYGKLIMKNFVERCL